MILLELRVKGFGRLRDLTLRFAPGLTVITGPNEAGKSTVAECIIRLLFGYPEAQFNEERTRFTPWSGAPHEAALAYRLQDGRELETWRDFGRDDVPTRTYDRALGREIAELSGSRKSSPGAVAFGLSLPAYEAAAVIRAADFALAYDSEGRAMLAERLAAVIGAAGDAPTVEATGRLQNFLSKLGGTSVATTSLITRAHADVAAAQDALNEYHREYASAESALRRRSQLQTKLAELEEKRTRADAQLSVARLHAVGGRIARGEVAEAALAQAQQRREETASASSVAVADRSQDVEAASIAWHTAAAELASAEQRVAAAKPRRDETERAFKDSLRELGQANTKVADIKARLDALPDPSTLPDISEIVLADLEAEADSVGVLDADVGRKETIAAFSRQRGRAGLLGSMLTGLVGALAAAIGFLAHVPPVLYGGAGAIVVAILLFAVWATGGRRQASDIAGAQEKAESARALYDRAAAELEKRCRAFGCKDVRSVRDVFDTKTKILQLRASLEDQEQAVKLCEDKRAARAEQLDDFAKLDRDADEARQSLATSEAALSRTLDDLGVPPGDPEQRLATWREYPSSGEQLALAGEAVARAERDRAQALGGKSLDDWRAEATRLRATIGDRSNENPEGQKTEAELAADVGDIERELKQTREALAGVEGELRSFARAYPNGSAEIEERLAFCTAAEQRLSRAKQAASLALVTLETVQNDVHRNFAPQLGQAMGAFASAVTDQRYAQALVDPGDFSIQVFGPERSAPIPIDSLSSGTREQIYLSLRAAVARALSSGEPVPMILDDALAHVDEQRLAATFKHLARMGEEGQQLLLFSQRGSVRDLAERLGITVLELPGPALGATARS